MRSDKLSLPSRVILPHRSISTIIRKKKKKKRCLAFVNCCHFIYSNMYDALINAFTYTSYRVHITQYSKTYAFVLCNDLQDGLHSFFSFSPHHCTYCGTTCSTNVKHEIILNVSNDHSKTYL